jgi:uncharacterized protein YcnI
LKKQRFLIAAAVAALAAPAAASAHVTVHPNALPSGGFTVITVRVPNERDKAGTKRVDMQLPHGFIFVSYQPVPGWKTTLVNRKLAKPVTVFGEKHTTEVGRVIWTGGRIAPGQYMDFPLSVAVPTAKAGSTLTFKALQTYSNGEIVRWIGSPSADSPAPQVLVRDKNAPVEDYPGGVPAARKTSSAHIAGAAVGIGFLAVGGLALLRRRSSVRQ